METMYTYTVYGSYKAFSPIPKLEYGAAPPILENDPSWFRKQQWGRTE